MTFSCPHFDMDHQVCMKLQQPCVPGRPGCVLRRNSVFKVPAEERIAERQEQQQEREEERPKRE